MSKRSSFKRVPRDFYPTIDPNAIPKTFLDKVKGYTYCEPCAGANDLVELLQGKAFCSYAFDIDPREHGIVKKDALEITEKDIIYADLILTNPPYNRKDLLPLIDHFISLKPTWLLLPADLMHNKYFSGYMSKCSNVVSVGRLKWFEDSEHTSTENYAWYYWTKKPLDMIGPIFEGRYNGT